MRDLFVQLIEEVQPRLVITVGTAGASNPDHFLGDVYITRAAKFRCQQDFQKAPFNNQTYTSDFSLPTEAMKVAGELVLDDEMAPLPPEDRGLHGAVARAAAAPLAQAPDTLAVLEDQPLWAALESIEHFKAVIDVDRLRKCYT